MEKFAIALVALSVVCFCQVGANVSSRLQDIPVRRPVQYRNFEDYLASVTAPTEASPTQGAGEEDGEGVTPTPATTTTTTSAPGFPQTADQILSYFRDVPRQQWSCCMVGMLAGSKGFHCHAGFYAARMQMRNYNRAHSRRMPLHTSAGASSHWGLDIMRTFRRCVTHSSGEFHKCCYAATVEQREMLRWAAIRNGITPATPSTGGARQHRSRGQV